MSVSSQTILLIWKQLTIRRRKPGIMCVELLFPLALLSILCYTRHQQPPVAVPQSEYDAKVLPSVGFVPLLEGLICTSGGVPDGFGFRNYPNSSTRALLEYIDDVTRVWSVKESSKDGVRFTQPPVDPVEGLVELLWSAGDVTDDVCTAALGPPQNRSALASGLILWTSLQKMLCGQIRVIPADVDSVYKFADYLGLSSYQRWSLALVHSMLSRSPAILFAPNSTAAYKIIHKANASFEYLDSISVLSRRFLNISDRLDNYQLPVPVGDLTTLACAWLELMGNYSLDWFRGFHSEHTAVGYFLQQAAADNVSVIAVLAFRLPSNDTVPNHLVYKIRQNGSLTARTSAVRDRVWLPGNYQHAHHNYYQFGFTWIQDLIERAVVSIHATRDVLEPGVAVQQTPYPCYVRDSFLFYQQTVVPLCLTVGWLGAVGMLVHQLVLERASMLRQMMLTLGVRVWSLRASWFVTSLLLSTPTMLLCTALLCYGGIFRYSSPSLVFCLLQLFVLDNIALAFLLSSVGLGSARIAAAGSVVLYFVMFVPFVYVSVVENTALQSVSVPVKLLMCLFSPSAFNLAFKYLGYYEQQGRGVHWHTVALSPVENDQFNMAATMTLMLVDILLYGLAVCYLDRVLSDDAGARLPWYFPLVPRYWRCGTKRQRHGHVCVGGDYTNCSDSTSSGLPTTDSSADPDVDGLLEPDPVGLTRSVRLSGVSKRYGPGRLAVSGLSLSLYEDQVTALLGHNGAGKTSTLCMLTGVLPVTSGRISVYGRDPAAGGLTSPGHDGSSDLTCPVGVSRPLLGFCPQQDVLFPSLTAAEHVWLYARLKGIPSRRAVALSRSLLVDLGLSERRDCDVALLSGGQRRKLSVAVAFIGGSRCVVLDEPTAGVDPHSRRAIWDLILANRAGRTTVICTHHMEEADVLANRIAIMSAGRVKCVGSPMFLRRQLGSGYHLHLVRSSTDVAGAEHPAKDASMTDDDHMTRVTALVQGHVTEARLLNGSNPGELHYFLPDTAAEPPLTKLMPSLFAELKLCGQSLGVSSYAVRTTTMDELFVRVAGSQEESAETDVALKSRGQYSSLQESADYDTPRQQSADYDASRQQSADYGRLAASQSLTGCRLVWRRWLAVLLLRYWCTIASWGELTSQFVLPSIFTLLAMSISVLSPSITDQPALVLSPTQYFNYTAPLYNVVPISNQRLDLLNPGYSEDASSLALEGTLRLRSGLGATCVLLDPFNSSLGFDSLCDTVKHRARRVGVWPVLVDTNGNSHLTMSYREHTAHRLTTLPPDTHRMYPHCWCRRDGAGFACSLTGYRLPRQHTLITGDALLNISRQDEQNFYLYTTDIYRLRRYGGLTLGVVRAAVPPWFGQHARSARMRRTAVRRTAKCRYNGQGYHALPAYVNALNNAVLRANLPADAGDPAAYGLTCMNHPLPHTETYTLEEELRRGSALLVALFITVATSFVPACALLQLVRDRQLQCRQLQRLAGLGPGCYWAANCCWHLLSSSAPSVLCIIIIAAFNDLSYSRGANLTATALLILVYGWTTTAMLYPISLVVRDPATAYISTVLGTVALGLSTLFTTTLFEATADHRTVEWMKAVFLVIPSYGLSRGMVDIAYNQYHNSFLEKTGGESRMLSPLSMTLIGRNLVAMAVMAAVGLAAVMLLELLAGRRKRSVDSVLADPAVCDDDDEDVAAERVRVTGGAAQRDLLKLIQLSKTVGSSKEPRRLVDRLSFGVAPGECFGLLGVNGAGKTTTFRMLTGATTATSGGAMLNRQLPGSPIDGRPWDHLIDDYSDVGYCPQHDALYQELTVHQHLTLYAMLRGLSADGCVAEVRRVACWLGLTPLLHRRAAALSGGTRRKLSTALALLGSPRLLLLDEPTTGMDPASRRQFWQLARHLVATGCALLLTSHSMEECEALCTRLGIMVAGRLVCIGGPQHLKNRFGDGYTITVRCGDTDPHQLDVKMKQLLPAAVLKEVHQNVCRYEMATVDVCLERLFVQLYGLSSHLVDYHVSQNTLDKVFVNFARQQTLDRTAE